MFNWDNYYTLFINLDSRPDRLKRMQSTLNRVGIHATRFKGITTEGHLKNLSESDLRVIWNYSEEDLRTICGKNARPGALGCTATHISCLDTLGVTNRHLFIMEDDLVFCSDFHKRLDIIQSFLDRNEWDIFWLGGTFHLGAKWHKRHHPADVSTCKCTLNRDTAPTNHPRILRAYGVWSSYAYLVNKNSLTKVSNLIKENLCNIPIIDVGYILISPLIKAYCFVPGCIKQHDDMSSITNEKLMFSNFSRLGPHWYQNTMEEFDPKTWRQNVRKTQARD